jgi:hypothetical protein
LDKGLKLGVFQIMCHGLTHMQPDLTSPPGWWGTKLDQERAEVGWYREFGDTRRDKEIPAAEQLWRMKTACRWLEHQFGVTPLEFLQGGSGVSTSYVNNTFRLAGQAGFGWYGFGTSNYASAGYLGDDMAIQGWNFCGTPDSPYFELAPPNAHDFGITLNPEEFATIFEKYPNGRFINIHEFIAYVHADQHSKFNEKEKSLNIKLIYDEHYCQYFKNHSSNWILEVSDWLKNRIVDQLLLTVDDKAAESLSAEGSYLVRIPDGIGDHYIKIQF